jgi:hypothetical protein
MSEHAQRKLIRPGQTHLNPATCKRLQQGSRLGRQGFIAGDWDGKMTSFQSKMEEKLGT